MTALTTMFNFFVVYINYFVSMIFGGRFLVDEFSNIEQQELARQIVIEASNGAFSNGLIFSGVPILALFLGVFVIGAIIGLARRLIRG